jgi:hypothetical protein
MFYSFRQTLSGVLLGTPALDPWIIVTSAFAMLLFGSIAAVWQSRRLTRVLPALALRGQET